MTLLDYVPILQAGECTARQQGDLAELIEHVADLMAQKARTDERIAELEGHRGRLQATILDAHRGN